MTTVATGNRRLIRLADFLETVPRKRFDYNYWVGIDWKGAPDLSCGTVACAGGWATTMPTFRRLGLRLNEESTFYGPTLHGQFGTFALATLFGMSDDESYYLFVPQDGEEDATPKQVARKIRRFVKARS